MLSPKGLSHKTFYPRARFGHCWPPFYDPRQPDGFLSGRALPGRVASSMNSAGNVPTPCSFCPGDFDQSNERATPGPLTTRTLREHRFLLSSKPAKRGLYGSRCYDRSSTCHAPKGAAARCCSVWLLAWPGRSGFWYVAPFLLVRHNERPS
jgi:hypothetical protein